MLSGPIKRAGKLGNGIDHYLVWAIRYVEMCEIEAKNPIKALAEKYDKSVVYVRDTVTDARHRYGLLESNGQGRAGGALTDKALSHIAAKASESSNSNHTKSKRKRKG